MSDIVLMCVHACMCVNIGYLCAYVGVCASMLLYYRGLHIYTSILWNIIVIAHIMGGTLIVSRVIVNVP